MSAADAISRVNQIQSAIASMQTAFTPPAANAGSTTSSSGSASFAAQLAQAQGTTGSTGGTSLSGTSGTTAANGVLSSSGGVSLTGQSVALPASASHLLTSAQQQFASALAAQTGLSPQVVTAWLLAEESGGAATSRQAAGNNDWLNIGYTDSGTYGSSASVWSNPITAANATAGWLRGQHTIPGYGTASSGIQAILATGGQSPAAQVAAIQHSGWASSGYPDLPGLVAQVGT